MATFEVARSVEELVRSREAELQNLLAQGDVQPLFLRYFLITLCLGIGPLLISRQTLPCIRHVRHFAFGLIAILGTWVICNCRTLSLINGTGAGALSFFMMRAASLLVFNDPERDFKRLEIRRCSRPDSSRPGEEKTSSLLQHTTKVEEVQNRIQKLNISHRTDDGQKSPLTNEELEITTQNPRLVWQGYPENFKHRLEWVITLAIMPSALFHVWNFNDVYRKKSTSSSSAEMSFPKTNKGDAARFMRRKLISVIKLYALQDFLFFLMVNDSFFQGYDDLQGPSGRINILLSSVLGLGIYRTAVCMNFFLVGLSLSGSLITLVLMGTSLLLPNVCSSITSLPLTEICCYEDEVIGPASSVYATGLVGFWGTYYHQLLRFDFVSCSRWMLVTFFRKGSPAYVKAKPIISVAIPFFLSGVTHTAVSYTQYGPTRPIRGVFMWFMVQPIGVFLQLVISNSFRRTGTGPPRQSPTILEKGVNFFFVLAWHLYVGPLLFDEYANGGAWQRELLPVNLMIGLGFSDRTKGWWRWDWGHLKYARLGVWHGERWWQSGIYLF